MSIELTTGARVPWSLDRDAPLARPVRRLLGLAALLVFLAGVQLFVFPLRTHEWFAWTIDPPMTAVFLGASYWASVGLELTAARARTWGDARIAVPAVFTFTALTFAVTLVHLDRFHLGAEHATSTRAVTWAWLAVYAVVPVLMVLAVASQARAPLDPATAAIRAGEGPDRPRTDRHGRAPDLGGLTRTVLVVLAVLLLALGTGLLVAPARAAAWWPWALTPLTARAVGAWLFALGVAAAHARLVDDVIAVRPLAVTGVAFALLQAVALGRHGEAVDWSSPEAAGLVALLAVLGVTSGSVLARAPRPRT